MTENNQELDLFEDIDADVSQETIDISPGAEFQAPEADDYEFATGDLDEYVADLQQPKEDMGVEQLPTDEEFAGVKKPVLPKKVARNTGRFVARMIDQGAARGLSVLSGEDYKNHKADDEEFKEIEEIITEMVQESGGELPLWVQLIIALFTVYGIQIYPAYQKFKERKK